MSLENRAGLIIFHDPHEDINGLLADRRDIIRRANTGRQFLREMLPNDEGVDFQMGNNTQALEEKGIKMPNRMRDSYESRLNRQMTRARHVVAGGLVALGIRMGRE